MQHSVCHLNYAICMTSVDNKYITPRFTQCYGVNIDLCLQS
jgi:hypothetical protein